MAKKMCTEFNVAKNVGCWETENGEEKKRWANIGYIKLFSEYPLPDDLTIMCELHNHSLPFPDSNPIGVFKNDRKK